MRPFDIDRLAYYSCPKCESNGEPNFREWNVKWVAADSGSYGDLEHLLISCARCGWSFLMEPADAVRK